MLSIHSLSVTCLSVSMSGSAETVVEKLHRLREEKAKKALEQEKTALAAAAATTEETNSTEPAKKRLVELGTPERDDNWVDADKKDTPIVNSKIYENRIFPVDPSHLVFAQYATYKAAPYFPGRICDYQEAITQGNIPAILTDNQVLVQFFVMDKNIFVVEKKKIRPYHCKAGEKAWDPERMQQIHKVVHQLFSRLLVLIPFLHY